MIFRNCTPFTDCLSKINNTQLGNDKYIDVVMSIYDLMEYNKKFLKKIQEVYVDLALNNGSIADFPGAINTDVKEKKTCQVGNHVTKNAEIAVPIKHFSKFWRTQNVLIYCEIDLIFKISSKICNNWYEKLCHSSNFINRRQFKTASAIKNGQLTVQSK